VGGREHLVALAASLGVKSRYRATATGPQGRLKGRCRATPFKTTPFKTTPFKTTPFKAHSAGSLPGNACGPCVLQGVLKSGGE
jgi:hypothetical protein